MKLDFSHAGAATVLARKPEKGPVTFVVAGTGGTGSFLTMQVGRLVGALVESGVRARAVFYDHDHVEPRNVPRQLFANAEFGRNKAVSLAYRYGAAWGLDITARAERFKASELKRDRDELVILVGCVDNAAGRREMAAALEHNPNGKPADVWWLDCGNSAYSGQVLLGSAVRPEQMQGTWAESFCGQLPAPSVQNADLLVPTKDELSPRKMSCAELQAANLQSLNINPFVACVAGGMLTSLLLTRDLKVFAVELNIAAFSMRATYATQKEVARACAAWPKVTSQPKGVPHAA